MLDSKDNEQIKGYQYPKNQQYKTEDIKGLTAINEDEEEDENSIGVLSELPSESDSSDEDGQQMMMRRANLLYDHEDNERIADAKNTGDEPLTGQVEMSYNPAEEKKKPAVKKVSNVQKKLPEDDSGEESAEKNVPYVQNSVSPLNKSANTDNEFKKDSEYDYYAPGFKNDIKRAVKNVTYNAGKVVKQIPEEIKNSYGQIVNNIKDNFNESKKYYLEALSLSEKQLTYNDVENIQAVMVTDRAIKNHWVKGLEFFSKINPLAESFENLDMAYSDHYMDTKFAHKHKIYNSYKEVPFVLVGKVQDRIVKQLGKDYLNKMKGTLYDFDDDSSKKLSRNKNIKNFIIKNKDVIKNYGVIDDADIEFTDLNYHNAIGLAKIANLYVHKNGEITFYVIDTYDFNKKSDNPMVIAGRKNQEEGILKPYFMIYAVRIDAKTAREYLK